MHDLQRRYLTPLNHIGNIDQTPIWMDMTCNRTVERRGVKTVRITTQGNDKARVTVQLGVTADGGKLMPVTIFKAERGAILQTKYEQRNEDNDGSSYPHGVLVRFQPKAWVDEVEAKWLVV